MCLVDRYFSLYFSHNLSNYKHSIHKLQKCFSSKPNLQLSFMTSNFCNLSHCLIATFLFSFINKMEFDDLTPLDELLSETKKVKEVEYATPASIER